MRSIRARLTFANVVSVTALFVALGGGAWAISANSVGSKQIKKGAVKKADLAANAVISKKVADGSLLAEDFAAGELPSSAPGPAGPQGPEGPQGPQGIQGVQGVPGEAAPDPLSPIVFSGIDFNVRTASTQLDDAGAGAVSWSGGVDIATAKVNLPDEAEITQIEFYAIDNTIGQLTFRLDSYIPSLGISASHGTTNSTGQTTGVRTFTLTPPSPVPVDSQGHTYELGATTNQGGANMVLYGARVFFTPP